MKTLRAIAILSVLMTGCSRIEMPTSPLHSIPTPVPVKERILTTVGDSITYGQGASTSSNSFAELLTSFLNQKYPTTSLYNLGIGGITSTGSASALPTWLGNLNKQSDFATIELGTNNLHIGPQTDPEGVAGLTYAEGVSVSYVFKNTLQTKIIDVLKANLSTDGKMAIATIYYPLNHPLFNTDPNTLLILKEFNKRIKELAISNKIGFADVYKTFEGHPEYFSADNLHPSDEGHQAIAKTFEKCF